MKLLVIGMFAFCFVSMMAMEQQQLEQTVVQQLQQQEVENDDIMQREKAYSVTLGSIGGAVLGSITAAVTYAVGNVPGFVMFTIPPVGCIIGCGTGYAFYRYNHKQGYEGLKSDTNIPMRTMQEEE